MSAINIRLYEQLKSKLGQSETEALIDYIDKKTDDQRLVIASKEDLAFETKQIELKIEKEIKQLELRISQVDLKIEQSKNDIVRWIIATAIALCGIIIAVAKML